MNTFDVVIKTANEQRSYAVNCGSVEFALERAHHAHIALWGAPGVVLSVVMRASAQSVPVVDVRQSSTGEGDDCRVDDDTLPGWEWAVEHGYSVEAWEMTGKLLRLVWLGVDNITVADICDAVAPIMDTKIASSVIHYDWFDEDE